jgi:hypothetical protein
MFVQKIDTIAMTGIANPGDLFWPDTRLGQHGADGAGGALPQHFHTAFRPPWVWIFCFRFTACNCNFFAF